MVEENKSDEISIDLLHSNIVVGSIGSVKSQQQLSDKGIALRKSNSRIIIAED
jgi:hypothetical protein